MKVKKRGITDLKIKGRLTRSIKDIIITLLAPYKPFFTLIKTGALWNPEIDS